MKRVIPALIAVAILGAFVWTLFFLYEKSQTKPVVYETQSPAVADIVKKTVATGAIVPRREVEIKPRVSGILEALYVEPGDYVKEGQKIAQIKIVPNVVNLNSAEARVKQSRISFESAQSEFARNERLFKQGVTSETEFSRFKLDFELKKQELAAANSNMQLIKSGAAKGSNKISNVVSTTVEGMVIEVPVKVGASVTETNNFNAGSTIANVADMNDLIFEGFVDESEVGKLKEGMELSIQIGAIDRQRFEGMLEYISPKGISQEGAIQFQIRAALTQKKDFFVRAGYSANADIVLDRREQVLSIDESLLQFDKGGKAFVEVETGEQTFEKRELELGLSDGLRVEVKGGLDESMKIKNPQRRKG